MVSRVPVEFVRFSRAGSLAIGALCVALGAGATDAPPNAAAATPAATVEVPAATPAATVAVPTAAPTLTVAEASARRALCDRYVGVISGRIRDAALLENAEVRALAMQEPDVATCGAVAADANTPCAVFVGTSEEVRGNRKDCVGTWSVFHELRAFPKGRGYMFDEALMDDCRRFVPMAAVCEPFRNALRSGDPAQCAQAGALQWVCRAYLAADPSLCRTESPELAGLDQDCRKQIERKAVYAKGLKGLAASGSARDRVFAQAASGKRNACAAINAAAKDRCVAAGQPPAAAPPPPPPPPADTPAAPPATPAAGTPAPNSGVG